MKQLFLFFCIIFQFSLIAQTNISGKVTDKKNNPIFGANIYLDGTYEGVSTNEKVNFLLKQPKKQYKL
jgi:hypothetical protein